MFCTFDPHLCLQLDVYFISSLSYNSLSFPPYTVKLGWIVWIKQSGPTYRKRLLPSTCGGSPTLTCSLSQVPGAQSGLFGLAWEAAASGLTCFGPLPLLSLAQCTHLGAHLNTLLGQYQQFQSSADSLQAWMKACEASVKKLLSDTVASDPGVLQQQFATTKVSRDTGPCSTQLTSAPRAKPCLRRREAGVGMPWRRSDSRTL